MLKRTPNPTFPLPVAGIIPGSEEKVDLVAKHKTRAALQDYLTTAPGRRDVDLVGEILADWPGAKEAFGDLNPESLAEFLDVYPAAAGRIVAAYAEALTGARLGN